MPTYQRFEHYLGEEGTTVMPSLQTFKSQSCTYSAFDTPGREEQLVI